MKPSRPIRDTESLAPSWQDVEIDGSEVCRQILDLNPSSFAHHAQDLLCSTFTVLIRLERSFGLGLMASA